jgi:hypothetical protein
VAAETLEGRVLLSVGNVAVTEGVPSELVFRVTYPIGADAEPFSIDYDTADGTAAAGSDYVA